MILICSCMFVYLILFILNISIYSLNLKAILTCNNSSLMAVPVFLHVLVRAMLKVVVSFCLLLPTCVFSAARRVESLYVRRSNAPLLHNQDTVRKNKNAFVTDTGNKGSSVAQAQIQEGKVSSRSVISRS